MRPWEYWSVPAAVVMGCCGAAVGTLDAGLGERGRVPLSASGVPRAVTTLSESCRTAFSEARQAGRGSRYRCIDPPTRTLPSLDNLGCRESCPAYQQIYEQVRAKDDVSFKTPQSGPSNLGSGNLDSRQDRSCLGPEVLREPIRCDRYLQHLQMGATQHSVVRLALKAGKEHRSCGCSPAAEAQNQPL